MVLKCFRLGGWLEFVSGGLVESVTVDLGGMVSVGLVRNISVDTEREKMLL